MYGSVISRTGWTFEYVDDSGLDRVLELLEFWRKEAAAIRRAQEEAAKSSGGRTAGAILTETGETDWTPPTEDDAMAGIRALGGVNAAMGGSAGVSRIPEELREAIRWAEGMKANKGIN